MLRQLRNAFFAGLIILAPLGVTIFVVNILREKVGVQASNVFFSQLKGGVWDPILELAAILIVMLFITALGFLSRYVLGRMIVSLTERIINAVPFVNTVYRTVKQIVDTFGQQKKAVFQEVVLVEYPRKGVYVIGFMTSNSKGEVQAKTSKELINIFIPTTPNPTSGFLLMVPKEEITPMAMSVADGMKLIVSGGAVTPPYLPDSESQTDETVEVANRTVSSAQ